MVPFSVQGERDGKGGTRACHYESMTEHTNTFRSTNKSHGKKAGFHLVLHQCCQYIYFFAWTIMHRPRISKLYAIYT